MGLRGGRESLVVKEEMAQGCNLSEVSVLSHEQIYGAGLQF